MVRKARPFAPNVLSARCPTRAVLDLIADKWTTLVIYLLSGGTRRYGELQREIDGISQKMLTQTLRNLEQDGLVKRVVYPEVPPRTEYSLTPLGETLRTPLGSLCEWAETHIAEVEKARVTATRHHARAARVDPMPSPVPSSTPSSARGRSAGSFSRGSTPPTA